MKLPTTCKAVLGFAVLLIAMLSASPAEARDRHDNRGRNYKHYHSQREHRHYSAPRYYPREYGTYRGHRGYWDNRGGIRLFINL